MLRFVLDTNVVLDLFHWGNTDAVPIMAALEAGLIECMADQRTLDELQRVLTYPQLKLTPGMISERYARYSSLVTVFPEGIGYGRQDQARQYRLFFYCSKRWTFDCASGCKDGNEEQLDQRC